MGVCSSKHTQIDCGWWFGTFFIFHNTWDNPSHWLIFFRGLKPPTCCSGSDCTVLVLKIPEVQTSFVQRLFEGKLCWQLATLGNVVKPVIWDDLGIVWDLLVYHPTPRLVKDYLAAWGSWLHPLIHWLIRGGVPYGSLPCEETSIWKTYHEQLRYVKSPFEPSKYLCWWLHMSYTDIYSVGTSNI